MLFSSRIYFDGSMTNLFRMDSSTIDALIRTVCPHLTTARKAPDAVLPPLRVAVFLYLCAQGSSLEATADRFAIRPSTVCGIVREVAAIVCREMQSLVSFTPLVETASQFMELCGVPQIPLWIGEEDFVIWITSDRDE
ncbi:Heat shock protein70 [Phytophthora megakarya]|uniref:Heat shock protein70 n=1 Tax=Phytophthora megakarya TaxID=4795 RepID=A0A225WQ63_9STRA|nr:Heat shock protein70 [Phytophthora megakarya]